jgi:hypothetical protein
LVTTPGATAPAIGALVSAQVRPEFRCPPCTRRPERPSRA